MKEVTAVLPGVDEVGSEGTWALVSQDGVQQIITGEFLGLGSSWRDQHKPNTPHTEGYAAKGDYCSHCRWTELRIFGDDDAYWIVSRGASIVPGERDLISFDRALVGMEVVERLRTRRDNREFFTHPASIALSQAAQFDAEIKDAYLSARLRPAP